MMENRVKTTITDRKLIDISNHEHIVLGLSGGPDSVCLFHCLYALREALNITIYPVHINHKFRPVAAEEDQEYVENICREKGLICASFEVDCNAIAKQQGISGEEAGRNARYDAFYKVATRIMMENNIGPDRVKIAVAQNANDQAETILMRIMRGTGTDGLAGIEYEREGQLGVKIIRPLLDAKRKDIEDYCEENKLYPRFDHTNKQPVYTRNKIRLELIPNMERNFNPNITDTLNRLSAIAKEDKNFMDSVVNKLMQEPLELEIVQNQFPAIRKRLLIKGLEEAGLDQGITWAHMEAADKLIMEGRTGTCVNLPKGYRVTIAYEKILFTREETKPESSQTKPGMEESLNMWFDGLLLRTRKPGDYIVLKNVGGRKKIQDMFIDMKVKKELRDLVPMLCRDNEVLWILGDDMTGLETGVAKGRNSANYQVTPEIRERIFVEYNKKM